MKKYSFLLVMLFTFIFIGCGSEDNSNFENNQSNYIEQNK